MFRTVTYRGFPKSNSLEFGTVRVAKKPKRFVSIHTMTVPEWAKKEVRSAFARASAAGRRAAKTEPRAARARYRARGAALGIELTNGAVITIPVKLIRL